MYCVWHQKKMYVFLVYSNLNYSRASSSLPRFGISIGFYIIPLCLPVSWRWHENLYELFWLYLLSESGIKVDEYTYDMILGTLVISWLMVYLYCIHGWTSGETLTVLCEVRWTGMVTLVYINGYNRKEVVT